MYFNKNPNISVVIITIIVSILSIFFILNTIRALKYQGSHPKDIAYVSQITDRNDYLVFLKNNDFISNEELDHNLSYITTLVEYIDVIFEYEYQGSSNTDLKYDYYVVGNIISNFTGDIDNPVLKPVWNKEFILVDHQMGSSNDAHFRIYERLKIGVDYYNNLINSFRDKLNISVDSILEIRLIIDINGKFVSYKFNQNHYMLTSIPLDVKVFDITTSKNYSEKETIYGKQKLESEKSYMMAIIYIVLLIVILYIGIFLIRRIINKSKDKYQLTLDKIFKDYNDRIVKVANFAYTGLKIINVDGFKELLNISNEVYEPIIYWEKKEQKPREAWFSIIRNKILYRYIVTEDEKG